jgi:hypothetical protein
MIRPIVLGVVCGLSMATSAFAQMNVGGCQLFPANNIWNTPVDTLPVKSDSTTLINTIGAGRGFHPDFGSGEWDGGPIGIPFITVPGSQTKYPVNFDYADESDPGPYAIPLNTPIEGGPNGTGDRHAITIDTTNCILYELFYAYPGSNSWSAGSGAIFDLKSNALRPAGWTSTDAAGLPLTAGLITYDEVLSGEIKHAIRFTAPQTRNQYVWPARHQASSLTGSQYPRMGERLRLKASFDVSPYTWEVQVILRAMKKYGLMLADNGSAWYITGKPDDRWNNDNLHQLGSVLGSNLEVVDATVLMVDPNSGATNSGASSTTRTSPNDFDRDARSDLAVYRPTSGMWLVRQSKDGYNPSTYMAQQWGLAGDRPVGGDYDGDGGTDIAVYRPSTGEWFIRNSSRNFAVGAGNWYFQWGLNGDVAMPGDYDGDRKLDLAVYRPASGMWYIRYSSANYAVGVGNWFMQWGLAGDLPLARDFDGDGKCDLAVYRPTTGEWYIRKSSNGYSGAQAGWFRWGLPGDVPVLADFDGDGKTDLTVFRPTTGEWYIRYSSNGYATTAGGWYQWGLAGDIPQVMDFDGDGKSDLTVYRPSSGEWFIRYSSNGFASNKGGWYQWGLGGDFALPMQ